MKNKIQVLLVEDDENLRDSLKTFLELSGLSVTAVANGRGFYSAIDAKQFQVAVIDLKLPDQNGMVLAEYARANTSMSIIMITANDSPDNRAQSYYSGCDLFIGKPVDTEELLAAISSLSRRTQTRFESSSQQSSNAQPVWMYNSMSRKLTIDHKPEVLLTAGEQKIMDQFLLAEGAVVTRGELLQALYRRDDDSSQRALDAMVRRLRRKINEVTGYTAPILTAYGHGYNFSDRLVPVRP